MIKNLPSMFAAAALVAIAGVAQASTSTFDDLVLPGPNTHYFPGGAISGPFSFTSGAATFNHDYTNFGFPGCCSTGWSYSNHTDTTTAGFGNQYSAFAGSGQGGSANYAVGFIGPVVVELAAPVRLSGAYFTNTTYAALSMRDGDGFAKKFGGASGNDPDFFKLTINGFNGAAATGSVEFFLADYRFADNAQDYIIRNWTFVNLSSLGTVTRLGFDLASTDNGPFGMNTPSYFAMDNLAPVPEPQQALLLVAGLALIGALRRKPVTGSQA
ncbi:MAG: DUF4465 domain-containing protein [Burkholderiales bacterium]|nr:DUF4465 domain-containing protein [Burkholderiales bacterium]